ncbi:MAG: DUF3467 domain-containing protein [Candidatus Doudnabacteria bacterium]|nr:DUF3467 domain-containing protein [Candidatus Doudnabacteria bacterium]
MENQQPQNNQQIQIKATDESLKGVYANMAQISHGSEEFILDFVNVMPPQALLVSRVVVSPSHFKRLAQAMQENLKKYEEKFGTISLAVVPDQKMGFRTE